MSEVQEDPVQSPWSFSRLGKGLGLLNERLESGGVGTGDIALLLAVLEEEESGHRSDADFLGDLGLGVDIHLVELDVRVVVREPLKDGGDGLAGTAPGRPEVNHNGLSAVDDGPELFEGVDGGDARHYNK